jgi:lipopolysaccharide transport system ATP-binding protein
VDEVLAVGDAEFQKKCLRKMEDVAGQGRTVIFVSHSMAAVQNLCKTVIVLECGERSFTGDTQSGIELYLRGTQAANTTPGGLRGTRPSWAVPFITSARLANGEGQEQHMTSLGGEVQIEMHVECPFGTSITSPVMGVVLNHALFGTVGGINMRMTGDDNCTRASGGFMMRCRLHDLPFLQGRYLIDLWLGDGSKDIDAVMGCLELHIEGTDVYGTGKLPFASLGVAYLKADWTISTKPYGAGPVVSAKL